jgi:hypothetical protein
MAQQDMSKPSVALLFDLIEQLVELSAKGYNLESVKSLVNFGKFPEASETVADHSKRGHPRAFMFPPRNISAHFQRILSALGQNGTKSPTMSLRANHGVWRPSVASTTVRLTVA